MHRGRASRQTIFFSPPHMQTGKTRYRRRAARRVSRILSPVAAAAAALYFLIDAIFLSAVRTIIRPLAGALSRSRIFIALAAWVAALSPYPSLALFLVPVIILEPAKPVGAYLVATGHLAYGVSLIAVGEMLKILIVERLFHFSRDKLMTIPAFARVYNWAEVWLKYFRSQPIWQATARHLTAIKAMAGGIPKRFKAWIDSFVR
jgi:hypothetical protein